MVINTLRSLVELYEKYSTKKNYQEQQKNLDLTLLKMYNFGQVKGHKPIMGYGFYATTEDELNSVRELSKMDLFNAIETGLSNDLIIDCQSYDQNAWAISPKGIRYVEALMEDLNKK